MVPKIEGSSFLSGLFSNSENNKVINIEKIVTFLKNNKEILFFIASSAFVLAATANPFVNMTVVSLFAAAVLTTAVIQGTAFIIGSKGFLGDKVHVRIAALMGIGNLACWLINPQFGAAAVVFNAGINLSSLAFKHIF